MNYGPFEPWLQRAAMSLADYMRAFGLTPPPESVLVPALLVTLVTVLIGSGYLATLILSPARSQRDTVLIVGVSPASALAPAPGKTTLFHVLHNGHLPPYGTVPSQDTNKGTFIPSDALYTARADTEDAEHRRLSNPVKWVDFPGYARLRPLLPEQLAVARVLVFVVDASPSAFARTLRESSDLLYDILTHPVVARRATPILLFCNKKDMPSCVPASDVRSRLEAELERARKARAAALQGARNTVVSGQSVGPSDEDDDRPGLGYDNEEFNFDHIANEVVIAAGSAKLLDVSAVCNFVAEHF
jgi:signal recognition particle receptor subunit beta